VYLFLSPNTNLDVGPYNVHHLYTGLLLVVAAAMLLRVATARRRG
jgi:chromosome condensin MukBEF MukE localization factor